MSHFSVLVVGEDIEGQIAPYSEELETEPYKERVGKEDIDSFLSVYGNLQPTEDWQIRAVETARQFGLWPVTPTNLREAWLALGKDWNGGRNGWDEDGPFRWSTYNPKSKWDWYELGGRWLGMLLVKQGAAAVTGRPGTFDNEPKRPAGVDQARVRDLDWEAMRRHARREAEERFEWVKRADAGDREARFHLWMDDEEIAAAVADPERWMNQESPPIKVRAVVKDGEWHERGEMGWFGMSHGDKSQVAWQQELSQILADLDADTLVSIVDCHI